MAVILDGTALEPWEGKARESGQVAWGADSFSVKELEGVGGGRLCEGQRLPVS